MLITRTELSGLPAPKRGKVRDIYDLGEELCCRPDKVAIPLDEILRLLRQQREG